MGDCINSTISQPQKSIAKIFFNIQSYKRHKSNKTCIILSKTQKKKCKTENQDYK